MSPHKKLYFYFISEKIRKEANTVSRYRHPEGAICTTSHNIKVLDKTTSCCFTLPLTRFYQYLHTYSALLSILGCPIVKKRKLEEAEAEENQSAPKRRNQPAKQIADECFAADSDAAEEEEEQKEDEEEDEEEGLKEKNRNKTKGRPVSIKSE